MFNKIKIMTKMWISNNSKPIKNFELRDISKYKEGNIALIGMRRLGKTEYLKYRYSIIKENKENDVVFMNFDDPIFATTDFNEKVSSSFQSISDSLEEIIISSNTKLVLIDEIQRRKEWTTWLKGLIDKYPNTVFVCTGSDATEMLSSSEFGGTRFKILFIGQYTYSEYFYGALNTENKSFNDYVNNNFLPDRNLSSDYEAQYEQVIEKQLLSRNIKRTLISSVIKYISLNPGMKLNPYNISKSLEKIDNKKVDSRQVLNVIEFLESSQLIFKLKNNEKSLRVKKSDEFRYYPSNFNTYRFFTMDRKYEDLSEEIPRKGLIFEDIIISNVYSTLDTSLKRSEIGYLESKDWDVDFVYKGRGVEIKSYDTFHSSNNELQVSLLLKMKKVKNPVVIHKGESKIVNNIEYINYEEFLLNKVWLNW